MLEYKTVTRSLPEYGRIARLYHAAFPAKERFPLWLLCVMSRRKGIDFYAFYRAGKMCGFAYLVCFGDMTFVLYLAVDGEQRSQGCGSELLAWIAGRNPERPIVLNIEAVEEGTGDGRRQRLRRLAFYQRNGYRDTGYEFLDRKAKYQVLCCGPGFSAAGYKRLLRHFSFGLPGGWKLTRRSDEK